MKLACALVLLSPECSQQAIGDQWTYVQFLARLLEHEVERRAQH